MKLLGLVTFVLHASLLNAASIKADFRCLWWSQSQMEGLDPNQPPAKETEVTLARWEYSDPVGVPHPEKVDVVVSSTSAGFPEKSSLIAEVEFKEGPLKAPAKAKWSKPVKLESIPASGKSARFSQVDLKTRQDTLFAKGKWPHVMRVTVFLVGNSTNKPLATTKAELPIIPGD